MPETRDLLISVVVPLYREGTHLANTLKEIMATLSTIEISSELILVDDGSPDNTWDVIGTQRKLYPTIIGIRLSRNFGKEAALAAGLDIARGDAIVVMDGDLQHPPTLIPTMVTRWREGADIVEAIKEHRGTESAYSKLRAKAFYTIFSRLTGYDLHGASDFKLMSRRVLDAWKELGERNLFFRGMSAWLGFRSTRIPFQVPERIGGESGWSLTKLIRLAMTAVTSFSSAPLHLITLAGLGFVIFAVVLGGQTLYLKFLGKAIDGFTTVILLLLVIGGGIMLGMGIIGTYIARIYDEVKGRPRYIISDKAD
jgi:glycosyltransferase involved in cell wall biosynthesis